MLAAVVLVGCSQPITVDTIQLGRSLNADQSIASQATTFKPSETVYVSALNSARGEGTISVRWYMGQQLLSEREKRVSFQGAGATDTMATTLRDVRTQYESDDAAARARIGAEWAPVD